MRYVGVVIAKELREVSKRKRTFFFRTALPIIILPFLFFMLSEINYSDYSNVYSFGRTFFFFTSYLLLGLIYIMTFAYCAPLIPYERERQTFDILLSTPLSYSELLLGKIMSRILLLIFIILSATPIMFICIMLGGVSLPEILITLLVLIGITLFCAGISVLITSIFRRSTTAIISSYAISIFFGFFIFAGLMVTFHLFRDKALVSWNPFCFIAISMNPVFIFECMENPMPFIPDVHPLLGVLADVVFFLICIFLSSHVLSKTAHRERKFNVLKGIRVKQLDVTKNKTALRGSRILSINPIYWKECIESVMSRPGSRIRVMFFLYIPILSVYCITALVFPEIWFVEFQGTYRSLFDARSEFHIPVLAIEFGLAFLVVVTLATGVFVKERSKKTLEGLMLTALENRSIFFGKFLGAWRQSAVILLIPFLHMGLCILHGIFPFETLYFTFLNTIVLFSLIIILGIGFSIRYRKRHGALFMIFLALSIAFLWIPVCAFIAESMHHPRNFFSGTPTQSVKTIFSLSPYYWLGFPFENNSFADTEFAYGLNFGIGFINYTFIYVALSFLLTYVFTRNLREKIKLE